MLATYPRSIDGGIHGDGSSSSSSCYRNVRVRVASLVSHVVARAKHQGMRSEWELTERRTGRFDVDNDGGFQAVKLLGPKIPAGGRSYDETLYPPTVPAICE